MAFALEITDLKKTYPGGVEALKGISFAVNEGDFMHCLDLMAQANHLP